MDLCVSVQTNAFLDTDSAVHYLWEGGGIREKCVRFHSAHLPWVFAGLKQMDNSH